jgi:hypothetical protein
LQALVLLADGGILAGQIGAASADADHADVDAVVGADHLSSGGRAGGFGEQFLGGPERAGYGRGLGHEISAIDGVLIVGHGHTSSELA